MGSPTPRTLGFRMPAEWAPHDATWLSWPRSDCVSFRGELDGVLLTFAEMARVISQFEPVRISVTDIQMEANVRAFLSGRNVPLANIGFHHVPTNEPWCRDHGPTLVARDNEVAVVDWTYNAYGGKFRPFDSDDAVPRVIAGQLGLRLFQPGIVLEGGSIDVNGTGAVLVTEACLLHPNRNPNLTRAEIEKHLRDFLGAMDVLWLGRGLNGDDTDGHVDDLTRFVTPDTVVTAVEPDPQDANYAALQDNLARLRAMPLIKRIIELPMPSPVTWRGQRQPASYANFYIANGLVLAPIFGNPHDAQALAILRELFPTRRVIGLDSRAVICGGGSFHCLTQQQPAA